MLHNLHFRLLGFREPKWERRDYRERRIGRALSGRPAERDGGTPTVVDMHAVPYSDALRADEGVDGVSGNGDTS